MSALVLIKKRSWEIGRIYELTCAVLCFGVGVEAFVLRTE
jgi:hypothetical protein